MSTQRATKFLHVRRLRNIRVSETHLSINSETHLSINLWLWLMISHSIEWANPYVQISDFSICHNASHSFGWEGTNHRLPWLGSQRPFGLDITWRWPRDGYPANITSGLCAVQLWIRSIYPSSMRILLVWMLWFSTQGDSGSPYMVLSGPLFPGQNPDNKRAKRYHLVAVDSQLAYAMHSLFHVDSETGKPSEKRTKILKIHHPFGGNVGHQLVQFHHHHDFIIIQTGDVIGYFDHVSVLDLKGLKNENLAKVHKSSKLTFYACGIALIWPDSFTRGLVMSIYHTSFFQCFGLTFTWRGSLMLIGAPPSRPLLDGCTTKFETPIQCYTKNKSWRQEMRRNADRSPWVEPEF